MEVPTARPATDVQRISESSLLVTRFRPAIEHGAPLLSIVKRESVQPYHGMVYGREMAATISDVRSMELQLFSIILLPFNNSLSATRTMVGSIEIGRLKMTTRTRIASSNLLQRMRRRKIYLI